MRVKCTCGAARLFDKVMKVTKFDTLNGKVSKWECPECGTLWVIEPLIYQAAKGRPVPAEPTCPDCGQPMQKTEFDTAEGRVVGWLCACEPKEQGDGVKGKAKKKVRK